MPLYDYYCEICGKEVETFQQSTVNIPVCCDKPMERKPSFPAMVKVKGGGGYPSRRKQFRGTAPYTSMTTRPNVEVVGERLSKQS